MFFRNRPDRNEQALVKAIEEHNPGAAADLLKRGANANARNAEGIPVLCIACGNRWAEAVDLLLKHGADPNSVADSPERQLSRVPALVQSAANGSLAVVRLLIAAGAEISRTDQTGMTALMCAAFMGHTSVIADLVAAGAPLEQQDQRGYTALMFASNAGNAKTVAALVEAGSRVNAEDHQRSTPIMFAAQHGHDDAVAVLMAAGANPNAIGTHGLSAIEFAGQKPHHSTLRLLTGGRDNAVAHLAQSQAATQPPTVVGSKESEERRVAAANLRRKALTGTRAAFGLGPTVAPTVAWGVLMETGFPEGFFTLVALSDGSASLYFSSGGGVIGGGQRETIREVSKALVAAASGYQLLAAETKVFPQPQNGQTAFYFLTDSGVFMFGAPEEEFGEGRHAASALFGLAHELIARIRVFMESGE
jgi:hypothetical protein